MEIFTIYNIGLLFITTDDLNVSGIIVAVLIVALVMILCGLGAFYAQKKGYFASK